MGWVGFLNFQGAKRDLLGWIECLGLCRGERAGLEMRVG